MKKVLRTFTMVGITMVVLVCALMVFAGKKDASAQKANVRTVEVSNKVIDAQAVFEGFENVDLQDDGTLVSFTGTKELDTSSFSEVDLIALNEAQGEDGTDVKYDLSINKETGVVVFTLSMTLDGEYATDTMTGMLVDNNGIHDAMFIIDGETIYLSDICNLYTLDDVGLFSKIKEAVQKAVTAVVNTAKKLVYEPIKVAIVSITPIASVFGNVVEVTVSPYVFTRSAVNLAHNLSITKPIQCDDVYGDGKYYITDQDDDRFYDWYFGHGDLNNNGCGIIATYNALLYTGKLKEGNPSDSDYAKYQRDSLANIICGYEQTYSALANGKLGLNPGAIAPMLAAYGVTVRPYVTLTEQALFEVACANLKSNQMAILCYWWYKDAKHLGAHYFVFTKSGSTYTSINNAGETFTSITNYLHDKRVNGYINGFMAGWIVTK